MTEANRRIVLAERPVNRAVVETDFRLERTPLAVPDDGQVLVRTLWLSLDPYMRTRMSAMKSYTPPIGIGEVMIGEVVGEVVQSRHPEFNEGDCVLARSGWQAYTALPGDELTRIDADAAPLSHYLGVLGMPGMTAYFGLLDLGRPQPEQTVLVSAAAGAVGQIVGQIAKLKGCHVIGTAGSDDKLAYVTSELGFDGGINYKGKDAEVLAAEVAECCPAGVDVFFDSVGGTLHDAVMQNLAMHARTVIVGTIARANELESPDIGPRWLRQILVKRATVQGFLVWDYSDRTTEFRRVMSAWLREGRIKYREDAAEGLEAAPRAFIGMLAGHNLGKQLVRCAQPAGR